MTKEQKTVKHRMTRLLALLTAAFILISAAGVQPAAARAGNGIEGPNSYVSPSHGFEVTWADGWIPNEQSTVTKDGDDTLWLNHGDPIISLKIMTLTPRSEGDRGPIALYLQAWLQGMTKFSSTVLEERTDNPDAAGALVSVDSDGKIIEIYAEFHRVDEIVVGIAALTYEGEGLSAAELAAQEVEIAGEPAFLSIGGGRGSATTGTGNGRGSARGNTGSQTTGTSTTGSKAASGETYAPPSFAGVSLAYDPGVWTVTDEKSADENGGRDLLVLDHADVSARLYVETYDGYNGKAAACYDAALGEVAGTARTRPLNDESGDPIEGSAKGRAWGAVSFTQSGTKLAVYIECQALPGAQGVLVFSLLSVPGDFAAAYADAQAIIASVDLGASVSTGKSSTGKSTTGKSNSGTTSGGTTGNGNSRTTSSGNTRGTSAAMYRNEEYGFSISVADTDWTLDRVTPADADGPEQAMFVGNETGATLLIRGADAGTATAERCVAAFAQIFEDAVKTPVVMMTDADGNNLGGENAAGYNAAYTFVGAKGGKQALLIQCSPSPDGSYFIVYVGTSAMSAVGEMILYTMAVVASEQF